MSLKILKYIMVYIAESKEPNFDSSDFYHMHTDDEKGHLQRKCSSPTVSRPFQLEVAGRAKVRALASTRTHVENRFIPHPLERFALILVCHSFHDNEEMNRNDLRNKGE
jgi:hypothetical protein